MEEWISLNEFCRRYKKKQDTVKQMIRNGLLLANVTEGGHYQIYVGSGPDTVLREVYEKERELRIKAETKLEHIQMLLNSN
jgi:hypothetical protein